MPKNQPKKIYICSKCSFESPQWLGQCPSCGEWSSFTEDFYFKPVSVGGSSGSFGKSRSSGAGGSARVVKLSEVSSNPPKRLCTTISEFDRVLGGGFVAGQVVLISGEPGIGKSTLLTDISRAASPHKVLYVCGEESIEQIKLRAIRMGYAAENLLMLQETDLQNVTATIQQEPDLGLVIIDSIQTMYSQEFSGIAGNLAQIRGCTQTLTSLAKSLNIPFVLVGHVTKDGDIAGPKILEHIVDTVLYLEGDNQHMYRLLRTAKNRFGPVSEIGIFEMSETGLREVKNPSELFLEQRSASTPGSCVTVVMEGYRPILFEVQALAVKTAFGYPKRTTSGFNTNRLQVLLAVLEKRCGLAVSSYDIYVSIAGGFKVSEYAADLAVCLAVASSIKNQPVTKNTVAYSEVGLGGELRRVSYQEKRSLEAKKLGYTNVVSHSSSKSLSDAISKGLSATPEHLKSAGVPASTRQSKK